VKYYYCMWFKAALVFSLLLPNLSYAWEDADVLEFITETNPIIRAQMRVTKAFEVPDTLTWVLQNTSVSGRVGLGGTEFRDTTTTVYGGLQFNIPLASPKEEREAALKRVAQAQTIDAIRIQVMQDMAVLRGYEADLAAAEVRMKFYKDRAKWLKGRMAEGYSTVDELWTVGSNLNKEKASVERISLLARTQRHKLARYAGDRWKKLLSYLEGKTKLS